MRAPGEAAWLSTAAGEPGRRIATVDGREEQPEEQIAKANMTAGNLAFDTEAKCRSAPSQTSAGNRA